MLLRLALSGENAELAPYRWNKKGGTHGRRIWKVKRMIFLLALASVVFWLAGCEGRERAEEDADGQVPRDRVSEGIKLNQSVTELEDGLSAVRYEGEDGFGQFLKQGGADSDAKVLQYVAGLAGGSDKGLSMSGNPFGCSTVSVKNPDGGYLFGRNFDWYRCEALVVEHHPADGYASLSTVNLDFVTGGDRGKLPEKLLALAALYAPLDGMNEKRLCVSVNMIQDEAVINQDTGKPDITTTTAIRLLLNRAADVPEALELLRSCDLHSSMGLMVHFAIADKDGNSVAAEYIGQELVVTQTPVLTNDYVAEGEKQGIGTEQSHTRSDRLKEALEKHPVMDAGQVRDALENVSKHHFDDGETTEWSVVFDASRRCADYYHREDFEKAYTVQLPIE